ncbi:hypothetical protein FOCC_FOCC013260, partial [Frankliniella occidentalis]
MGRVVNINNHMLQLDALLQVYTLLDSETRSELRVPHRVRRIILDSDRTLLHEDGPEGEQEEEEQPTETKVRKDIDRPLLQDLVFRLHRATSTLRCANMEISGVETRPFPSQDEHRHLAVDLEQLVIHGDHPAAMQNSQEMLAAAVQLATQQAALQPLSRKSTETVVGLLQGTSAALEQQLQSIAQRSGGVLVRRLAAQEAVDCDLLVGVDAHAAAPLLAPHAVLLAELPTEQPIPAVPEVTVLLQQAFGARRLVLFKKPQAVLHFPHQVVEVDSASQVAVLQVPAAGVTYVVWHSMPEQGIPALLRDVVRSLPGAHRVRSVFLLDATAPKFSPTHPFFTGQMKLGLAVNVLLNGAWGNLYLKPKPIVQHEAGRRELRVNRVSDIPNMNVQYLGLNGSIMEPTNIKVRDGYILDIEKPTKEQQPRGVGLLDYAGTKEGVAVMGVMDTETMAVDNLLQWAVPKGWSLEDAATVPYAYAMAYTALVHTAKLLPRERVLIHDGWSAIGQAGIDVALATGGDLPPDHVLNLQGEQFELDLSKAFEDSDRMRRGYRVLLSTLSGEGLWASLRRMAINARVVQINGSDSMTGTRMGMNLFIKSTSFYAMDSTGLLHLSDDVRRRVHGLVQAGLDNGVVRPLDRTVLPISHVKEAVSYLDGDSTAKAVLEMGPSKVIAAPSGFQCDHKASYIVVGGCRSEALHTVDWLLSRGTRCVVLAGLQESALSQTTLRRLALMRARWGAHVTTVPGVRADTPQGASTLVARAANMAPLHTILVLPS